MGYKPQVLLIVNKEYNSNLKALVRYIPSHIDDKYRIKVITFDEIVTAQLEISGFEMVITEGHTIQPFNHQIYVDIMDTFPLFAFGRLDKNRLKTSSSYSVYNYGKNINAVASYSAIGSTLFNACRSTLGERYHLTGMPKNDLLFDCPGRLNVQNVLGMKYPTKTRFILCSFYSNHLVTGDQITFDNFLKAQFNFSEFNAEDFYSYLIRNNFVVIFDNLELKIDFNREQLEFLRSKHIAIISRQDLILKELQMYELLNGFDMLITDISPIYVDYLLLDRPIIFNNPDHSTILGNFMLSPHDFWLPGAKFQSQSELQTAISGQLSDHGQSYKYEINRVKSILHYHYTEENRFSENVWGLVDRLWEGAYPLKNTPKVFNEEQRTMMLQTKSSIANLIERGEFTVAESVLMDYERKIEVDPDTVTMKAVILYSKGEVTKALNILYEGRQYFPHHFEIHYNLAQIYLEINETEKGEYYLRLLSELANNESERQLLSMIDLSVCKEGDRR